MSQYIRISLIITLFISVILSSPIFGAKPVLSDLDVFEMELATDPQISPDGEMVVYVRNFMDIQADRRRGNLWMLSNDGKTHRPLTSGMVNDFSPRFSPDGKRLAYVSTRNGSPQIFIRYLDTAQEFQVAQLQFGAGSLSWSPNGQWLAFNQFVPAKPASEPTDLPL